MSIRDFLRKSSHLPHYCRIWLGVLRIITIRLVIGPRRLRPNRWLILERGIDAQDNGWHFFKFMVANHPEIEVRYAIRTSSADYRENLAGYEDKIIEYDSFAYYRYLFSAGIVASSHANTYISGLDIVNRFERTPLHYKGKIAWLQHGITHQEHGWLKDKNPRLDLMTCGARREYDLLKSYMGKPEILYFTGFARFDNLHNLHIKRQILVMPTWRSEYVAYTNEQFRLTPFYQNYHALLTDSALNRRLAESGYRLVFYNHMEFQRFNPLFEDCKSANVEVMAFGEKRVQELLKESGAVLTDYSSVYYDALYMDKPILFFQFDRDYFDAHHYGQDYDRPEEFGILAITPKQAVDALMGLIDNECEANEIFKEKAREVFPLRDADNCTRIFKEITKLEK